MSFVSIISNMFKSPTTETGRFGASLIIGGGIYSAIVLIIVLIVCWSHWQDAGLALGIVFAGATAGILIGFTFGIPKLATTPQEELTAQGRLVSNSNFGRVSDWLTTIVIGLSIAQFGKVLDGVRWLGSAYSDVFSTDLGDPAAAAFGISLTFSSIGIGFVMMFMWTSTRLLEVFEGGRKNPTPVPAPPVAK